MKVALAASEDGGVSWGEPWIPHDDRSPPAHGFVTVWPVGEGRSGAVWLDGRKYVEGAHGPDTEEMTLRAREMDVRGRMAAEQELDTSDRRLASADAIWVPAEMREIVRVAFGCRAEDR